LYAQWKGSLTPVLYGAVGPFAKDSAKLDDAMEAEIHGLAVTVRDKKIKSVTLYGYTAATGLASLDKSLSSERAETVATYLRKQFSDLKVEGVTVSAAGEGSIEGNTSSLYSRVEAFVL
jgi:outer membrane protein OmpA-like peptidoglycan-associated protein